MILYTSSRQLKIKWEKKVKKKYIEITNPRNDATTVDYCYCDDDVYAADVGVADDEDVDLSPLVVVSIDYVRLMVCTKRSAFKDGHQWQLQFEIFQ